ncbi:replicative helicase loader/inhibitor [Bacillus infantis]|uniref:replicative helicase loader/inhibitor n=1 Tax=Bacillus infantis TaxID=324767 RepID=UPI003CF61CF8
MDKREFATFAMAIKTYYPRENILPNQQAMELWFRELSDIPYEVAEAALRKWVVNNKWSPSIADIREMTSEVTQGEIPDWGDAWDEVCRAIRNYGSYGVQQAMESFRPLTYEAVKRMGFRNLCMSENVPADRANFRIIYEQVAERKKKEKNIPAQLGNIISGILENQEKKLIGGGTDGS